MQYCDNPLPAQSCLHYFPLSFGPSRPATLSDTPLITTPGLISPPFEPVPFPLCKDGAFPQHVALATAVAPFRQRYVPFQELLQWNPRLCFPLPVPYGITAMLVATITMDRWKQKLSISPTWQAGSPGKAVTSSSEKILVSSKVTHLILLKSFLCYIILKFYICPVQ